MEKLFQLTQNIFEEFYNKKITRLKTRYLKLNDQKKNKMKRMQQHKVCHQGKYYFRSIAPSPYALPVSHKQYLCSCKWNQ